MCSNLFGDYTNPSSYSHKILQACFSHCSTCTSSLVAGVLSQSWFKLCQSFTAAPPHCPRTPSHRETNTGSGKPFCFITKERKTRSTFSENTRLVCFLFFLLAVLPIFLFLWNASIQTAACEMFPPSFSGAGDIDCLSSKKSGLPYFWIFILVLSAQGNKCEALSGSSILLTLFFFLLFISNT